MPRPLGGFLPDTSCIVAALVDWHECHEAAVREVSARLDAGERFIVAAPALVESYAVLTRLPAPHRLSPGDALALLEANLFGHSLVALEAVSYRALISEAPARSIAGGRTYDAVIARCAVRAGAEVILTFNERHFRGLAPGIEIVTPAP
ncbi:MAG TPA: PIN domain-containing protein [Thermoanaerobaculia bacterium]